MAVLNVIWVVPRDTPPPSPHICARTGKSGCVALGTVQDTQGKKKHISFHFCLASLCALGSLQGTRQVDAGICHAVENARSCEKTSTEQAVTCKSLQIILFWTW